MDDEARIQGQYVDIGADESDGCGWYSLGLSASPYPGTPGSTVAVTANVKDWNGQNVAGARVCFSVSGGTLTHVNGNPLPPGSTSGCGQTDANGNATATVTRATAGLLTLTASVSRSCGIGQVSESLGVYFGPYPADVVFVLDYSGSMAGHEASYPAEASVQTFVREVSAAMPAARFGAVMFSATTTARSISLYTGPTAVDDFCNWVSGFPAYGGTTAQLETLNGAAEDLETTSPTEARRFVVFVTDDDMDNSTQEEHLALVQRLDALTQDNGGGVFVSLWEIEGGTLHTHYSTDFTNDPLYPSLAVNGRFDPTNYNNSIPAADRYFFTNLKARILQGQ